MKTENYFKKRSYTKEQFIIAVNESPSIRQVLIKLNLKPSGGNYRCIKTLIQRLNLDSSHFTGQSSNKGKKFPNKRRNIFDYLSNTISISSYKLKLRLLDAHIKKHKCEKCKLTKWNNKLIPLELHHIDGNHNNNNLNNIKLLCPNCHSQTISYRRRKSSLK